MKLQNSITHPLISVVPDRTPAFLRTAYQLEEAEPPSTLLRIIVGLALLVLIAFTGSAMFSVPRASFAPGQLQPAGAETTLRSLKGGVIEMLAVSNGSTVGAGDLIAVLEDPEIAPRLKVLERRQAAIKARIQLRLQHFHQLNNADSEVVELELWNEHASVLALREQSVDASTERLRRRRDGLESQNITLADQGQILDEQLAAAERIHDVYQSINQRRIISDVEMLRSEQDVHSLRRAVSELEARIQENAGNVTEVDAEILEYRAQFRHEQIKELEEFVAQLIAAEAEIEALNIQRESNVILAPHGGVVFDLNQHVTGSVLQSGDKLARLLPTERTLSAHLSVPPSDIIHLREGQLVEIDILGLSGYDHGPIGGTVAYISPSSLTDANGEHFFRVHVLLEIPDAIPREFISALRAGASVNGTIITGERTLLEYLAKPVLRGFNRAFGEP
jgi:HlyD family secretion protein/adhesin transport system membrane fusion protein